MAARDRGEGPRRWSPGTPGRGPPSQTTPAMTTPWSRPPRPARKPAPPASPGAALRRRPLVEVMEGRQLLSTLYVTTATDNGNNTSPTPGSLRAAILQADAQPAGTFTTIDFKIG